MLIVVAWRAVPLQLKLTVLRFPVVLLVMFVQVPAEVIACQLVMSAAPSPSLAVATAVSQWRDVPLVNAIAVAIVGAAFVLTVNVKFELPQSDWEALSYARTFHV